MPTDAERYRWLRNALAGWNVILCTETGGEVEWQWEDPDALDTLIDASIEQGDVVDAL